MKLTNCILIIGLCAFILQFSVISCVDEAENGDTEVAEEATDTEAVEEATDTEAVEETANEVTEDVEETSNTEVDEESTDTEVAEEASNSETTNDETEEASTDSEDDSDSEVEEELVDVTEAEIYVPPVGTELDFTLETGTEGLGLNIYFTQMEDSLSMHCEVTAQEGTAAANLFPAEFSSDDASESDSEEADANEVSSSDDSEADSSDADSSEGDANVITNDATDEENTDTANEEETVEEASDTVADAVNDVVEDVADSETVDTETDTVADSESDTVESSDDTSESADRKRQARGTCTSSMPYIYLLKDTDCCSDPKATKCASTEAYNLGCIDKTGSSDHDFPDLMYSDVENYCLAITDQQVSSNYRSLGLRTPKFIASGPSFFRTFSLLNFNNVNFLSSGTKTISSNPSTGAVSINFPAYIQPSPGGSYNPGFFDTLPHIRLEGLTADYINVIILLLLLTYVGSIFLPALNLGPLVSQFTAPFERMGDFVAERMDVLENKVKASIRKYHRRRYYNDVRRVDYHNDYEYIDDDYYYYDK